MQVLLNAYISINFLPVNGQLFQAHQMVGIFLSVMVYVVYWSQTKGLRVSRTFSPLVPNSRLIPKSVLN